MKKAFVLALALALGAIAAMPGVAPANDRRVGSPFATPVDPWAHWGPPSHFRHEHGFVSPGHRVFVPQHAVFVPGQWAWNGFSWVWIPGHWAW